MADQTQRKRVAFFSSKDAQKLGEDRMPTEGLTPSVLAGVAKLMSATKPGLGEDATVLFAEPGETGMSLVRGWFKSGYILPAHSHSHDCLYYVLAGELRMGSHVVRAGDGFLLPADTPYSYEAGPDGVEVLEFRNATHFNIVLREATEDRWDQLADNYRDRAEAWETEITPPSARR